MAHKFAYPATALLLLCGAGLTLGGCTPKAPTEASEPAKTEAEMQAAANKAMLDLADAHGRAIIALSPETATALGLPESFAGEGYNSRLADYSVVARADVAALNATLLRELKRIDRAALSGTAATTYDILDYAYTQAARRNQFNFGDSSVMGVTGPYTITQLSGPHLELPRLLLTQQPLSTRRDAEAFLARLGAMGNALDAVRDGVLLDAEGGVVPPAFALEGAAAAIAGLTAPPAREHQIVEHFSRGLDAIEELSSDERAALVAQAADLMELSVYPAYARLRSDLGALIPAAGPDAGVWRLDDGAALYELALLANGADGRTPDDVHALGLAEVERISAQMNSIMDALGEPKAATAGLRFANLAKSPDLLYPNTDQSRAVLLATLADQIRAINTIAPDWFATLPPQPVEVRRIPIYEQDSAPGGYYTPPAIDGSRPGIYWINLKDTADWPKHTLKTLTYHEAVPGHHFQIALQLGITDLPMVRNLLFYSEFAEGWALYAEQLAAEMGMYTDDPLGDLGRLQSELFRAGRLVVDTGLHHKRWTREEAIDWMITATGESAASVEREIERYAVWPGQATSYKLGMLRLLELRTEARTELGDGFDIRAFHDAVLKDGSLPMPVLADRVRAYIAATDDGSARP